MQNSIQRTATRRRNGMFEPDRRYRADCYRHTCAKPCPVDADGIRAMQNRFASTASRADLTIEIVRLLAHISFYPTAACRYCSQKRAN